MLATDAQPRVYAAGGYGPPGGNSPGGGFGGPPAGPPPGGGYGSPPGAPPGGFGPPGGPPPGYGPPGAYGPGGFGPGGPGMQGPTGARIHPLAIVSLVLGVFCLPSCFCCGFGSIAPIAALICGVVGIVKIDAMPQVFTGKSLCYAGIGLAALGLVLNALAWLTTWDEAVRASFGR